MSSTCTITTCKRISYGLCHCCQQDICLSHLKEHQDVLISQLNPLVDQMVILENRVNILDSANMISDVREKLEQWRIDCYKKIDDFFEQKYSQLNQYANKKIDKQRENITQMRSKLIEVINGQEVTPEDINSLKRKTNELEKEMNKTEHTSFHIQIESFIVNGNLIITEKSKSYQLDISSLPAIYKTINCTKKNSAVMATNENFLLMHQESNLCLIDREFTLIRKTLWSFGEIWDMFWSLVLKKFIVINENKVFLIDEDTMSIENTQIVAKQNWCCGTCSDKSLFLATYKRGSSIIEFNLLPSIEFVKEWKSPDTCSKYEGIHDMTHNNENIFLIIENQVKKTVRVELRSSITLDRLWSLLLNSADNQNVQIRSCLFNDDEWIVAYHDFVRLLHITKDGKLKASCSYTPAPHFVSTFGPNLLVIATLNSINLHKLK